jgi:hypothetical protein
MLCLCTTLGQDGLTARLLVVHSGHVLGGQAGSRSIREGGVAALPLARSRDATCRLLSAAAPRRRM